MRHAFLISTHNNEEITKQFLQAYDDEHIDFYIHVDRKAHTYHFELFHNVCRKAHVYFVERIPIYWGTFSQIQLELQLLEEALEKEYDYYHFISGCDIPLFTKTEFLAFFKKHNGKEFVEFSDRKIAIENKVSERIQYYYIFMNSIRNHKPWIRKPQTFIRELLLKFQKKFKIQRNLDIEISYGSNWFDITHAFAQYVVKQKKWIAQHFHHSSCADEIFLQTIMLFSPFKKNNYYNEDENKRSIKFGRYVDWKRGQPYTFQLKDYDEIKSINSSFFIRKFDYDLDSEIVNKLFQLINTREETYNV